MELLIALLKNASYDKEMKVNVEFGGNLENIVNNTCFQTLLRIHNILDNHELSDFECIEEIVCALEDIDFNGGSRHDF